MPPAQIGNINLAKFFAKHSPDFIGSINEPRRPNPTSPATAPLLMNVIDTPLDPI